MLAGGTVSARPLNGPGRIAKPGHRESRTQRLPPGDADAAAGDRIEDHAVVCVESILLYHADNRTCGLGRANKLNSAVPPCISNGGLHAVIMIVPVAQDMILAKDLFRLESSI